jgi:hypothetical protein
MLGVGVVGRDVQPEVFGGSIETPDIAHQMLMLDRRHETSSRHPHQPFCVHRRDISVCDAASWVTPDRCMRPHMACMRCSLETTGFYSAALGTPCEMIVS